LGAVGGFRGEDDIVFGCWDYDFAIFFVGGIGGTA
jgi:hypothetical protein